MSAANRKAWTFALVLARHHFDGIPAQPIGDSAADVAYWQALYKVRKDLRLTGYTAHMSHLYAVRGLSALRKERALQEAQ